MMNFTSSQRCLWSNNYEFNFLIFAELSQGTVIAGGDGCEQKRERNPFHLPNILNCHTENQVLYFVTGAAEFPHKTVQEECVRLTDKAMLCYRCSQLGENTRKSPKEL